MSAVPSTADDVATCIRSINMMATGTVNDNAEVYGPDASNRESKDEPPDARGTGPEAFHATALWLRGAFANLSFEVHDAVQDGDLVVLHATMAGRQTGPFTAYTEQATVEMVFPPRGREFAVTQTHWFRMKDGKIVEHWANRDDLTMGKQLGWTPPTPIYLAKMLMATRQLRRKAKTQFSAPHVKLTAPTPQIGGERPERAAEHHRGRS